MSDAEEKEEGKITLKYNGMQKKVEMLESYAQLYKKALLEFGIDKDKYNLSFKYYDSEKDLLDIGTEICYSDFLSYYKHNGNKLIIEIFTEEKIY